MSINCSQKFKLLTIEIIINTMVDGGINQPCMIKNYDPVLRNLENFREVNLYRIF